MIISENRGRKAYNPNSLRDYNLIESNQLGLKQRTRQLKEIIYTNKQSGEIKNER